MEKYINRELNKIITVLKDIRNKVESDFKVEIKGIFGSFSRGEQKEASDVDILVEFKEGATLFDLVGLSDFLEEKLNRKVDVISRRAIRPELKDNILKEIVHI